MRRSASGFGLTVWSAIVVPIPALALALVINGPHAVDHAVAHVGWLTIGSTLYTVLGASLFGYGVWNSLLSRYPVGSVVPFTLMVPAAGIATAWIVLAQTADADRDARRASAARRCGDRDAPASRRSPSREYRRSVSGVRAARATTARLPTITVASFARVIAV